MPPGRAEAAPIPVLRAGVPVRRGRQRPAPWRPDGDSAEEPGPGRRVRTVRQPIRRRASRYSPNNPMRRASRSRPRPRSRRRSPPGIAAPETVAPEIARNAARPPASPCRRSRCQRAPLPDGGALRSPIPGRGARGTFPVPPAETLRRAVPRTRGAPDPELPQGRPRPRRPADAAAPDPGAADAAGPDPADPPNSSRRENCSRRSPHRGPGGK